MRKKKCSSDCKIFDITRTVEGQFSKTFDIPTPLFILAYDRCRHFIQSFCTALLLMICNIFRETPLQSTTKLRTLLKASRHSKYSATLFTNMLQGRRNHGAEAGGPKYFCWGRNKTYSINSLLSELSLGFKIWGCWYIQNLQRSPIPQTSNWQGTFFLLFLTANRL